MKRRARRWTTCGPGSRPTVVGGGWTSGCVPGRRMATISGRRSQRWRPGRPGTSTPDTRTPGSKLKTAALRAYLKSQLAVKPFLHNRALGLWAASHLKDVFTEAEKDQFVADLFAIQHPDGGWSLRDLGKTTTDHDAPGWRIYGSHPDGAVSDGYATGLVVLALKRTGVPGGDERLKHGVVWLSTNLAADGTWPTV